MVLGSKGIPPNLNVINMTDDKKPIETKDAEWESVPKPEFTGRSALNPFIDEWIAHQLINPRSPFNLIDNSSVSTYMGWLNWLVPVSQIVAILQVGVVAVGIYYVVVIVLRWIKAID